MLKRKEPRKIDSALKEAVAIGLLQMLQNRVSGTDPHGEVIYGARPSEHLSSGFLLSPKNQGSDKAQRATVAREDSVRGYSADGDDAITRSILITSQGIDLQIHAETKGELIIQPHFFVYLRMIPTWEEVCDRELLPTFRLEPEVDRRIRQTIRQRMDDEASTDEPWEERRARIRRDVLAAEGLPENLQQSFGQTTEDDQEDNTDVDADEIKDSLDAASTASEDGAQADAISEEQKKDLQLASLDGKVQEEDVPMKWVRVQVSVDPLTLTYPLTSDWQNRLTAHAGLMQQQINAQVNAWLDKGDRRRWVFRERLKMRYSDSLDWSRLLARLESSSLPPFIPEFVFRWNIHFSADWQDDSLVNVRIALENRSPQPPNRNHPQEPGLFGFSLDVALPKVMHHALPMERIKPSYRVGRFLEYPGLGVNAGVERKPAEPDRIKLKTTWSPRFYVPRLEPVEHPGIDRTMRRLAQPSGHLGLEGLRQAYADWLARVDEIVAPNLEGLDSDTLAQEKAVLTRDKEKGWGGEIKAVLAGLDILEESYQAWQAAGGQRSAQSDPKAAPYEAWLAMNEAMANLMKARFRNDASTWRLFQLAFILANLPALVTRMPEFAHHFDPQRDEAVTLLYFATGGGKSEAFLGLLSFNLLLDRLRGKRFGVTAMLRYPLRLLTIQQANRTAAVLAEAEHVRQQYSYGGEPFSIGFWVGSEGAPNRRNQVVGIPKLSQAGVAPIADREKRILYEEQERRWRKLAACPFCGAETVLRRNQDNILGHVCINARCDSHGGEPYKVLPFYICDEDIYDKAPSVLLGTVDKLALIGHSESTIKRVFSMFGLAGWRDDKGHLVAPSRKAIDQASDQWTTLKPAFKSGEPLFYDPFPSLLVQDEAHLLNESLGTFASLFETLFESALNHLAAIMPEDAAHFPDRSERRKAKVIAASATVSEPERHMQHLYQRSIPMLQFPFPGPDIYHSFYAQPQYRKETTGDLPPDQEEQRFHWSRIYAALLTNGRPHTSTTVSILGAFHVLITDLYERLLNGSTEDHAAIQDRFVKVIPTELPTANRFVAALLAASPEEIITLVDLHRIALTYVTNKKGGDQILSSEREETLKLHEAVGLNYGSGTPDLITGDVDQGEIKAVIDRARDRVDPGQTMPPLRGLIRSVIATSAVSHGVDVDEFNAMFFAGMPSNIAEYIQASSRVGRAHTGFVLLIPTPQQRRDRYIVEVFDGFHRFLERMVQPAPIDRFAERAMLRTLPSIWMNYLAGILPLVRFTETDKKPEWQDNHLIGHFIDQFSEGAAVNSMANRKQLVNYALESLGLNDEFTPASSRAFYRDMVAEAIDALLKDLSRPEHRTLTLLDYVNQQRAIESKPMTSLRDVDRPGALISRGRGSDKARAVQLRTLMRVARLGHR